MGIDQVAFVMVELPEVTSPEAALIGSDRKWRHRKWPWPIGLPEVMCPSRDSSDARMRNRKLGSLFYSGDFLFTIFFPFYHFLKKKSSYFIYFLLFMIFSFFSFFFHHHFSFFFFRFFLSLFLGVFFKFILLFFYSFFFKYGKMGLKMKPIFFFSVVLENKRTHIINNIKNVNTNFNYLPNKSKLIWLIRR